MRGTHIYTRAVTLREPLYPNSGAALHRHQVMTNTRTNLRTWHYGFRLGDDEAIRLAERIRSSEPVGSEKLEGLPGDLSPILDIVSAEYEEILGVEKKIREWTWGYIQAETRLPILDMLKDVAIPLPDIGTEDYTYDSCQFLAFATWREPDPTKLDITAHRRYSEFQEKLERVRAILLDDGSWYQNFGERSFVRARSLCTQAPLIRCHAGACVEHPST